jgi:hypothetical protein
MAKGIVLADDRERQGGSKGPKFLMFLPVRFGNLHRWVINLLQGCTNGPFENVVSRIQVAYFAESCV